MEKAKTKKVRKTVVKDRFDSVKQPFKEFLQIESTGGILLIIATIAAMIIANSGIGGEYESFWRQKFMIGTESFNLDKTIIHWINDGLMAIFFFMVGLEIKRELIAGELSSPKKAALPIFAAIGGMLVPAGIFLMFNSGGVGSEGWGIPMATDIAFSLGILSLLGKRVPLALKVFLVAFAIVDDLGAVVIIALFYSSQIHFTLLLIALALIALLFILNHYYVHYLPIYLIIGLFIWFLFLKSGVHPTIAGVLVAFSIPTTRKLKLHDFTSKIKQSLDEFREGSGEDEIVLNSNQLESIENMESQLHKVKSPLQSLEHSLYGIVTFFIMPLFAFANAGVIIKGAGLESFDTLTLSIAASLVFGKIIGIFSFSFILIKLKVAELPNNITWNHIFGAAMLGGIGFTMSLFISNLAYESSLILINQAKLGILMGSLTAAVLGYFYLKITLPKNNIE